MIQAISYKDREGWLKIRKNYIGGSDASAVIGMNPWRSRYALWAEKTGKTPGFGGNLTTEIGSYLEDKVAELFTRDTGLQVRRENKLFVNDEYPWACADIDRRIVGHNAGLEIKTTNSVPIMRILRNSDEFPEIYYAQCVHYLSVKGWDYIYLAVLVNCRDLKIYKLERDGDEIRALMDAERDFWELVKNDTPPAVDESESTAEALSLVYPESHGEDRMDLTGYEHDLEQYLDLQEQIKGLTSIQKEIGNRIKSVLKDAPGGDAGQYSVLYKSQERRTFDAKAFSAAHPALDLAPFYKISASRPFSVKRNAD